MYVLLNDIQIDLKKHDKILNNDIVSLYVIGKAEAQPDLDPFDYIPKSLMDDFYSDDDFLHERSIPYISDYLYGWYTGIGIIK